jgi:hypothetical protein
LPGRRMLVDAIANSDLRKTGATGHRLHAFTTAPLLLPQVGERFTESDANSDRLVGYLRTR